MRNVTISTTAIVKDSVIGEGSQIWEFANVYGAKIGENTKIGSYVEIQNNTCIGNDAIISSHSFICSLVTIEDNVFIGHGVMTVNDLYPPSKRRTGSDEDWKPTLIKKNAIIGSNATLMPVVIGENSIVGAGAVVTKDVPDNCIVAGNPAKIVKYLPNITKTNEARAMKILLADLKLQHSKIREELDAAITKVVDDCSFIMSEQIAEFENNFAEYCQAKHVIGVSNGTSAISLALEACGIKEGDEVITTPHTFIATTEAISKVGAKIKFVDIEEKTHLMDITKIEAAITENTKAIIPVHLNGLMCNMSKIRELADRHNLKIIEDSAQAHGALYNNNNPPGFHSDAATFSFFPGKNLGAFGDAGAVITNNDQIAEKIRMLRNHGRKLGEKHNHEIEGYNERLDSIQAAVLKVKLQYLNEWNKQRIQNAQLYQKHLDSSKMVLPYVPDGYRHVYHQYVIRVKDRERLTHFLKESGISFGINYPIPLHLQPAYAYLGYKTGDFPIAERLTKEIISLPMFPELSEEQIKYVADKVNEFLKKNNE